jgi:hypothetical protein
MQSAIIRPHRSKTRIFILSLPRTVRKMIKRKLEVPLPGGSDVAGYFGYASLRKVMAVPPGS